MARKHEDGHDEARSPAARRTERAVAARRRAEPTAAGSVPARAMLEAAGKADLPALERLVARGGDPNASYRNYRPLHALIQSDPHEHEHQHADAAPFDEAARWRAFEWLLEHGADPELEGAWPSASALVVAGLQGSERAVELLLARGARRDAHALAALGELAALRKLLARSPELARATNTSALTPLHCAAGSRMRLDDARRQRDAVAIVELLLAHGADPNALAHSWSHDVDPAYFAIGRPVRRLELLIDAGTDATNALRSAAWNDDPRWLDLCIARGGRADLALEKGRPILNELVRWGQFAAALRVLERGASPNVPDDRGWTALHQAVSRGNERMLRALLDAGGDRDARDASNLAPSDYARVLRKPKLLALLDAPVAPARLAPGTRGMRSDGTQPAPKRRGAPAAQSTHSRGKREPGAG